MKSIAVQPEEADIQIAKEKPIFALFLFSSADLLKFKDNLKEFVASVSCDKVENKIIQLRPDLDIRQSFTQSAWGWIKDNQPVIIFTFGKVATSPFFPKDIYVDWWEKHHTRLTRKSTQQVSFYLYPLPSPETLFESESILNEQVFVASSLLLKASEGGELYASST